MNAGIDAILGSFETALEAGAASDAALDHALRVWRTLPRRTERDRYESVLALGRIILAALPHVDATQADSLRDSLTSLVAALRRRYERPDSAFLRSRAIVETLARALAAGQDISARATQAHAELEALPFAADDELERATAMLAVDALGSVYGWRRDQRATGAPSAACSAELHGLQSALAAGGDLDAACVERLAITIAQRSESSARERSAALLLVFGLAIEAAPDSLPALDAVRGLVLDAYRQAELPRTDGGEIAARCRAVLDGFDRQLAEHGFSEDRLNEAFALLHELEPKTPVELETWRNAFAQILDRALAKAPGELAATLSALRETVSQLGTVAPGALSPGSLRAEGAAVLQRLEAELSGGAALAPSVVRALGWFHTVPLRISEGADSAREAADAVQELMPQLLTVAAPYVPPGQQQVAEDLASSVEQTLLRVRALLLAGELDRPRHQATSPSSSR